MNTTCFFVAGAIVLVIGTILVLRQSSSIPKDRIMELRSQGAIIVDVRSASEYQEGHAPGSLNIPLKQLQNRLGELDRAKPVLVCCASGARSSVAKSMLERAGFQNVHNVGAWSVLR